MVAGEALTNAARELWSGQPAPAVARLLLALRGLVGSGFARFVPDVATLLVRASADLRAMGGGSVDDGLDAVRTEVGRIVEAEGDAFAVHPQFPARSLQRASYTAELTGSTVVRTHTLGRR
jgi:hypothetical protein